MSRTGPFFFFFFLLFVAPFFLASGPDANTRPNGSRPSVKVHACMHARTRASTRVRCHRHAPPRVSAHEPPSTIDCSAAAISIFEASGLAAFFDRGCMLLERCRENLPESKIRRRRDVHA